MGSRKSEMMIQGVNTSPCQVPGAWEEQGRWCGLDRVKPRAGWCGSWGFTSCLRRSRVLSEEVRCSTQHFKNITYNSNLRLAKRQDIQFDSYKTFVIMELTQQPNCSGSHWVNMSNLLNHPKLFFTNTRKS